MRSLIICNTTQLKAAFCEELKKYDNREHLMSISFMGAHGGRITCDELYDLTFNGKFNFSHPNKSVAP